MREQILTGWSFAFGELDPPQGEWRYRLLLIDGRVDEKGEIVEGTGSGEVISVLFDRDAAATLHEQTGVASSIKVADSLPALHIPGRKPRRH